MRIVIDASVIVDVMVDLGYRRKVFRAVKGSSVIGPPSIRWEIGNALTTMMKKDRINLAQALSAFTLYEGLKIDTVDIEVHSALALASAHRIHAYDAYVIQCARQHQATLLSSDQGMLKVAGSMGIPMIEVPL